MFKRPRIKLPATLILAIAVLFSVTASSGKAQAPQPTANDPEKIHSQIFHGDMVPTIPEYLSETTGDITITSDADHDGLQVLDPNAPPYPPERLVNLACYTDAVVIATPVTGVSHLTADQSFIYSDWTMHIEEVLQDTPKAPIKGSQTISVVRPGGKLLIAGSTVIGVEFGFPEFRAGNKYLLFLTYIPQTGAFKVRARRAFNLSIDPQKPDTSYHYRRGETVSPDQWLYKDAESTSPEQLITNTRGAITFAAGMTTCKKEGNQ